jgi:FMN phosphatase YigB (HAD superfamily)
VRPYHTLIGIDLDATLINGPFERAVWPVILDELSAKSGLSPDLIRQQIEVENEARQNDPGVPAVLAMDWDDIVATVARRLGVHLETSVVGLATAHAANAFVLDEGEQVLHELAAPHRCLVVATKGLAKYQLPVLAALGLTPLFTDILTPDRGGVLKKGRAFWGAWPEQARLCIMVGDRYDDDVLFPAGFGFKTIWKQSELDSRWQAYNPFERAAGFPYLPDQRTPADAIITSLRELPQVVRRLEQTVLGLPR